MNTSTHKECVSLSREFQKRLYDTPLKNGVIDNGKYRKWASKWKCTEYEYHVSNKEDANNVNVRIYCDTTQLTSFQFCVP